MQHLGHAMPLRRGPVLEDVLDHEVAKGVAAQLRGARQHLGDQLLRLLRRAVLDDALKDAAAVTVAGRGDGVAAHLGEHEAHPVRREDLDALLQHVVGVGRQGSLPHVAVQLLGDRQPLRSVGRLQRPLHDAAAAGARGERPGRGGHPLHQRWELRSVRELAQQVPVLYGLLAVQGRGAGRDVRARRLLRGRLPRWQHAQTGLPGSGRSRRRRLWRRRPQHGGLWLRLQRVEARRRGGQLGSASARARGGRPAAQHQLRHRRLRRWPQPAATVARLLLRRPLLLGGGVRPQQPPPLPPAGACSAGVRRRRRPQACGSWCQRLAGHVAQLMWKQHHVLPRLHVLLL
mmetsp:Transcript_11068/g.29502  ORF Transcript_11068/g.29502 Transcript_11068/m.29502 type:complete len:345 (-) Transcript_11068:711-1745(-)